MGAKHVVLISLIILALAGCERSRGAGTALNVQESGTTTMQWPASACFKFSTGKTSSFKSASSGNADPSEMFDITLEPWTYPGWCTNFIDMGAASFDSLENPPSTGYNDDKQGFRDCTKIKEGHAYWIKTRDGKYAKIRVTQAEYVGPSDDGNVNRVSFRWQYFR